MKGLAIFICMFLLAVTASPGRVFAQATSNSTGSEESRSLKEMSPEERRAAIDAMSDEELEVFREKNRVAMEKRRAEWQAMTPKQRQAKRKEIQERRDALTPEEREAMRQRKEEMQRRQQDRNKERPADTKQEPPEPG